MLTKIEGWSNSRPSNTRVFQSERLTLFNTLSLEVFYDAQTAIENILPGLGYVDQWSWKKLKILPFQATLKNTFTPATENFPIILRKKRIEEM